MSNDVSGPEGFGASPFDDFLARIYGAGDGPMRPGQRVDITQLMSGPARELLASAAAQATQWGDADLDTAWSAEIQDEPSYEPEPDMPEATAEI